MYPRRAACIAAVALWLTLHLFGQRGTDYDRSVVSQVRIDLRDLGYPPLDVIPSGESEVRALAVAPDGRIYGATSGERSHLFVLVPQHGWIQPLGFLPDVKMVHHALVVAESGAVAVAPRPLLVLIEKYSPEFDDAARRIRTRYQQLGVPEKFATGEADDPHAWTLKLRQATTDWFCRCFYNRSGPNHEPDFMPEPPKRLYCTPDGSVRYSQQGDTVFSLILKKQAKLPPARPVPANRAVFEIFRAELEAEVRKLLHYQKNDLPLGVRHLSTTPRKGCEIEKLEFLSETGIYIPTWVFVPERKKQALPVVLYVNEAGKQADGMEFSGDEGEGQELGVLEQLARKGNLVVAVDVRGIGDTKPDHLGEVHQGEFPQLDDIETVMTYWTWEMNESLLGMRVLDVVRSVDYTLSRKDLDPSRLRLIGKGMGALWSLYAAALDTRIRSVICEGGLLTYHTLTEVDRYLHGANILVPGALQHFDLPHVAATVADRHLVLLRPVDAMKVGVAESRAREAYQWAQEAYTNVGVADRLCVLCQQPNASQAEQYLELLEGSPGVS